MEAVPTWIPGGHGGHGAGRSWENFQIIELYPLVNTQKAIENGHRNSGFSHEQWWIFPWQNGIRHGDCDNKDMGLSENVGLIFPMK